MSTKTVLRLFDFDNTIYDGNATMDFFKYSLKKHKTRIIFFPIVFLYYMLFQHRLISIETAIEVAYKYLVCKRTFDRDIEMFWDENYSKIKPFYNSIHSNNDLIISASLDIILEPFMNKYGVEIIASRFDKEEGRFFGQACIGIEKRNRLYLAGIHEFDEFYTDSYIDTPIIQMANAAYLVTGDTVTRVLKR